MGITPEDRILSSLQEELITRDAGSIAEPFLALNRVISVLSKDSVQEALLAEGEDMSDVVGRAKRCRGVIGKVTLRLIVYRRLERSSRDS